MKIKIDNIPNYSHEYLVTNTKVEELSNGTIIRKYKLGINKYLIVTSTNQGLIGVEFDTSKKVIKIPKDWYQIIN